MAASGRGALESIGVVVSTKTWLVTVQIRNKKESDVNLFIHDISSVCLCNGHFQ